MTFEASINAKSTSVLNSEFDRALKGSAKMMLRLLEVPARAFFQVGLIGGHQIETDGGFFALAEGGEPAVILPVYDAPTNIGEHADADLVDLVSWYPGEPNKWWQRTGLGWALGQHLASFSFLYSEPIRFHRRPIDWLRARGEGVCLLDMSVAYDRFGQAKQIAASGREHGFELSKLFEPPALPRPEIVVPKGTRL